MLKIFEVYILPIFEYGLPVWITGKYADSVEKDLNAILLKYLKRYLGVHYKFNTAAINHLCQTVPLFGMLWNRVENVASSIILPPQCSGLQLPSLAKYSPRPSGVCIEPIPSTFWRSRMCFNIPWNSVYRKKLSNEIFDTSHCENCSNKDFHKYPDISKCICIMCNQPNHPYHSLYFCDHISKGNTDDPFGVE